MLHDHKFDEHVLSLYKKRKLKSSPQNLSVNRSNDKHKTKFRKHKPVCVSTKHGIMLLRSRYNLASIFAVKNQRAANRCLLSSVACLCVEIIIPFYIICVCIICARVCLCVCFIWIALNHTGAANITWLSDRNNVQNFRCLI